MSQVQIRYAERLVAFIDVMGFKSLLQDSDASRLRIEEYFSTAVTLIDYFKSGYEQKYKNHDFASALVSDAIILSVILPESQAEKVNVAARFFSAVGMLQYRLAVDRDIWIRGAISSGSFFIDSKRNIVVGPAFVRAYELEQLADYARVIIDPCVCASLNMTPSEFAPTINSDRSVGKLMPFPALSRFDILSTDFDALQIDWLSHALVKDEPLDPIFRGIRKRLVSDQRLFQKAHQFLRMMREALTAATCDRRMKENDRTMEIDRFLKSMGM